MPSLCESLKRNYTALLSLREKFDREFENAKKTRDLKTARILKKELQTKIFALYDRIDPVQFRHRDSIRKMINAQYVGLFSEEGRAVVKKGDKYGFIDRTGKKMTKIEYDFVDSFSEGLARVQKGNKWGFIDRTGKEVIKIEYDEAYSFKEGLANVKKGDKTFYIDKRGNEVF